MRSKRELCTALKISLKTVTNVFHKYLNEMKMDEEEFENINTLDCLLNVTKSALDEEPNKESLYYALHDYLWTLKAIEFESGRLLRGLRSRENILNICPGNLHLAVYLFMELLGGRELEAERCNLYDRIEECGFRFSSRGVPYALTDNRYNVGLFLHYLKKIIAATLPSLQCVRLASCNRVN